MLKVWCGMYDSTSRRICEQDRYASDVSEFLTLLFKLLISTLHYSTQHAHEVNWDLHLSRQILTLSTYTPLHNASLLPLPWDSLPQYHSSSGSTCIVL